jgi:cell division protein FtsB
MRAVKYLAALWVGLALYALLSVTIGASGFSAYSQLEAERNKQQENLTALGAINKELEREMEALRYDRDTLTLEARNLGYGKPGEMFVRIVGLGAFKKQRTEAGQVIAAVPPEYVSNHTLALFSFSTGAADLSCMKIFDILKTLQDT